MLLEELIYKNFISSEELTKRLAIFSSIQQYSVLRLLKIISSTGRENLSIRELYTTLIYRQTRKDTA